MRTALGSSSVRRGAHQPAAGAGPWWVPCDKAAASLLGPHSCLRANPQSHQGPCCWVDGELSVPSGKTEWVSSAVTQALKEAAALRATASPSEGEGTGRGPVSVVSWGLYPAWSEFRHLPWPEVPAQLCPATSAAHTGLSPAPPRGALPPVVLLLPTALPSAPLQVSFPCLPPPPGETWQMSPQGVGSGPGLCSRQTPEEAQA